MKQNVVLIGHGTVGRALYKQLKLQAEFSVVHVVVVHPAKHKDLPAALLSTNAMACIADPKVSIILDAIDDTDGSLAFAEFALQQGKTYITASKRMVASNLEYLQKLERSFGGRFLYEAAVCGAIPIIRTLREHLSGEVILSVRGIVNGTCNYILTSMADGKTSFAKALKEAQKLGFAESDPTSDVDGWDAYYKATIIAHTVAGGKPDFSRVKWMGIREVKLEDVAHAKRSGKKIKQICEVRQMEGRFTIDIRPAIIGADDSLFHTDWEMNAVEIVGKYSGLLLFRGAGAGGDATASAMIGDLRNAPKTHLDMVRKLMLALN